MTSIAFLDALAGAPLRTRGLVLIAAISVALCALVADQQIKRATGQEVILEAAPIDPRELLRGDYIALDYKIAAIDPGALAAPPDYAALRRAEHIYLVMRQDHAGAWRALRLTADRPARLEAGAVAIRGVFKPYGRPTAPDAPQTAPLGVDIGADRYFADAATAKALSAELAGAKDGNFSVVLSVDGAGGCVIKALVIAGVRRDESLF